MEKFYEFVMEQLGDDDNAKFALYFDELDGYLVNWGLSDVSKSGSRTNKIEKLRNALSLLAHETSLAHPDIVISIREYISAENREVVGFGFDVKREILEASC